eukprot:TRINITY_DN5727_c0_g1_i1.p1 TRINITY_DN5727_c0_g1~~TRINITY_DN5727_c0_g1_i1.p1  ORF type:complete len:472 (-),score=164.87 TRINITY_DN5727_c0_g1_i1:60-1400(-)
MPVITPENVWTSSCKDVLHPHDATCFNAYRDCWIDAFKFALKMHTPMYLLPAFISHRKDPKYFLTRTFPAILRSSVFLATLPTATGPVQCGLRNARGKHHPLHALAGGLFTGLVCILIEHPSRRNELVVYTMNQLAETLFKMGVIRGWWKPVPKANCFIFVIAMSILSYQYHYQRKNLGNIRSILKFFLGDRDDHPQLTLRSRENEGTVLGVSPEGETEEEAKKRKQKFMLTVKKELTIAFKSTVRAFFMGIAIRGGFGFLVSFVGLLRKTFFSKGPQKLSFAQSIYKICLNSFGRSTVQFSLFLFLMVGGWRFTLLALRILTGTSTRLHTLIAGAVSGLSMFYSPSTEIAMYFASKAFEGVFRTGVEKGLIKSIPNGDVALFTLGCGVLFYACVAEPWNLRPSYHKFLINVSGGRAKYYVPGAKAYFPEWYQKGVENGFRNPLKE